jgi:hypothetical protein
MDDEPITPLPAPDAAEQAPEAVISAQSALRLLLALLTIWTFFSGLALIFFQERAGATIGGGLEGGEGTAAQRLLGVHLLVLAPIYGLLAWEPQRYRLLLWVPYVAQGGVVVVTAFDILTRERDFADGVLPLIIAATFLVLLIGVWRAGKRPEVAPAEAEAAALPATPGGSETTETTEEAEKTEGPGDPEETEKTEKA